MNRLRAWTRWQRWRESAVGKDDGGVGVTIFLTSHVLEIVVAAVQPRSHHPQRRLVVAEISLEELRA